MFQPFCPLISLSSFPSFLLSLSSSASLTWKPKKEENEGKKQKEEKEGGREKGKRPWKNKVFKMLFWEGVLGQIRTITTTTTRKQQEKNNNKKTTTREQQQESNNKNNNNTSSNTQKTTTTQTRTKQATTTKIKKQTNNRERQKQDPEKSKKWTKVPPNCSWLKNRAEKRAHPPNAFTLQKQAFQKIKTQNFYKMCKEGIFYTNILQIGFALFRWTMRPQKTLFL